jgi:hypothetical protein
MEGGGGSSRLERLEALETAQVQRRARLAAFERRVQYLQLRVAERALARERQNLVSPVPSAAELLRASSASLLEPHAEDDAVAVRLEMSSSEEEDAQPPPPQQQQPQQPPQEEEEEESRPVARSRSQTASARWRGTLHAGWLWKEGDGLFSSGDFKRRYFVLEQTIVRYYEVQPELVPGQASVALRTTSGTELARGMFDARGCVVGQPKNPRKDQPYCLRIDLQKRDRHMRRKYILAADTKEEMVMWAAKLNQASAGLVFTEEVARAPAVPDTSIAGAYDVIQRCMVRSGCELDSAERGFLETGQTVQVLESRILTTAHSTQSRARVADGWVSIVSASGELMLQRQQARPLSDEVVEAVPPERASLLLEPQPEPEPEPTPEPEPEPELPDSIPWLETLSSLLSRDWHPDTDRICKKGALRIVEEQVGWMAAFSDRAERRDRRASVTASTVAPQYACELNGLHFRWMTEGDTPSVVGMVQLDVASVNLLNVDKSMTRVIAIPGYYLCAETHADAVDWLMSMVFNCQTAIYAQRYATERRLAPPDAEEIRSVDALLHERANGGLGAETFSPRTVRHRREESERILLGLEIYRGPPQLRQTDIDRAAYAALDGSSDVQVDLQLQQPASRGSVWETVHQTEAKAPSRIVSSTAPDETVDMRAVSYSVMLSFEIPRAADRRQLSQRVRLIVRRFQGSAIGEPFNCTIGDLVQPDTRYFKHRIDFSTPKAGSPKVKQAWPPQDRYGNQTGAHLGLYVYQPDVDRPAQSPGFTDVVAQSYLIPVERPPPVHGPGTADAMHALRDERQHAGQRMFFDAPVVGLGSSVPAFIVTEHLQIPRAALEMPVCFLTYRMQQLRSEILTSLEDTKAAATPTGPARILSAHEELMQYARVCRLKQKVQKTLMLLPWYSSSLTFYKGLLERCAVDQESFIKTSTLKKDRDWAFVATNLCHHSMAVDCVPSGDAPTASMPLFSGITSGVQAAHCEGFDLLGETGVGLLHMDDQLREYKRLLAAAEERAAYNLRPASTAVGAQGGGADGAAAAGAGGGRPRMLTHMEDALDPEQRISSVVDQLENRVQSRNDIVLSQLLSTVAAGFLAMFQTNRWKPPSPQAGSSEGTPADDAYDTGPLRALRTLERTGVFYIQFESLLSTRKNEKGMIEDLFYVIDRCMPSIQLRCVRAEQDGCLRVESCEVGGGRLAGLRELTLGLSEETFAMLPPRLVEADGTRSIRIRVLAVMFTQGINEQQSLAHHMGEGALEDRINQHSLKALKHFFADITRPNMMAQGGDGEMTSLSFPEDQYELELQRAAAAAAAAGVSTLIPPMDPAEKAALREALTAVHIAVDAADGDENKHPEILLSAEHFSALVGGARVTS